MKYALLFILVCSSFAEYGQEQCPDCKAVFAQSNGKETGPLMMALRSYQVSVTAFFNEFLNKPLQLDTAYRAVFNANFIFEYLQGEYDFDELLHNFKKVDKHYIFKVAPQEFFVRGGPTTTFFGKKNLLQNIPSFRISCSKNLLCIDESDVRIDNIALLNDFLSGTHETLVIIYRGHLLATCKCINWMGLILHKDNDNIAAYIADAHVKKADSFFYKRIIERIFKLLQAAELLVYS